MSEEGNFDSKGKTNFAIYFNKSERFVNGRNGKKIPKV